MVFLPAKLAATRHTCLGQRTRADWLFMRRLHVLMQVGGGRLSDALQLLTTSIPFWASLAGTIAAVSGAALPPTLAAIVPPLAAAHLPLALLTAGAAADLAPPQQQYQLRDVAAVLAARLVPSLLAGAAAAAFAPPAWLPLCLVLVLLLAGTPRFLVIAASSWL